MTISPVVIVKKGAKSTEDETDDQCDDDSKDEQLEYKHNPMGIS